MSCHTQPAGAGLSCSSGGHPPTLGHGQHLRVVFGKKMDRLRIVSLDVSTIQMTMIHPNTTTLLAICCIFPIYLFSLCFYTNVTWEFSAIFDDSYNFLQYPALNHFIPPNNTSFPQHLLKIVTQKGINVYEPVGSLVKASWISIVDLDPRSLRVLSFCNHLLNGWLLHKWLNMLFENQKRDLSIIFITTVFIIHPLNMEVIGWLSAFSYIPALSFSLLSSIFLEKALALRGNPNFPTLSYIARYRPLIFSIFFFVLGSLSKAPAIMVSCCHFIRVLCVLLSLRGSAKETSSMLRCFLVVLVLSFFVVFKFAFASNELSNPDIHSVQYLQAEYSWAEVLSIKASKAVHIFSAFVSRLVYPVDLRIHYQSPPSSVYLLENLGFDLGLLCLPLFYLLLAACYFLAGRGSSEDKKMLVWGLLNLFLCWAPGTGIIQHGWTHLGGNRYLYLALAYFTPAVVAITDSSDPARKETGKAQPQLLEAFGALGLRVLVVGWLLLLTTKSAAHLKNFSQDELLLKECIRHDSRDWECLQSLGEVYGKRGEAFVAEHRFYNFRALQVIEEDFADCPRLRMFQATLEVGLKSLDHTCSTVQQTINRLVDRLTEVSKAELPASSTVSGLLRDYRNSSSTAFKAKTMMRLFRERDLLERVSLDLLPMFLNNQIVCFMVSNGLNEENARSAIVTVRSFLSFHESHGLKRTSGLFVSHLKSLREHLTSIEAYLQVGGSSYQGNFLH